MNFVDALSSAIRNLRVHLLRSALTMLSMTIGVAVVIVMLALSKGAGEQVLAQTRILGTNLLVIWSNPAARWGVRPGSNAFATLYYEDAVAIEREITGLEAVAPIVHARAQIVAGNTNWMTMIYGVDLGWFAARSWNVASGRVFDLDETVRSAQVVLLCETVSRKLFGDTDPVGQDLRVRNVPLRVVGVMTAKGQSTEGVDQDDCVLVPILTARQRIFGHDLISATLVTSIYVKSRDTLGLPRIESEITALLRERHRLQPHQENDFGMRNLTNVAQAHEANARTLELLLVSVAAISLAIGGIGIMNIMLVSVTERTREIGVRISVGARQRDILQLFLLESVILAVTSGAIGVLTGIAAAYAIASFTGWSFLVEVETAVFAVLLSGAVGFISGVFPALRASRLDPVRALGFS